MISSSSYSSLIKKQKQMLNQSLAATASHKQVKKITQIAIEKIPLSRAIIENPSMLDNEKISIVQKFVDKIDHLHKKYLQIETLYLINNNLKTIEGIQQFHKLKSFSAAYNEIDDPNTYEILRKIPTIEILNLTGNPITKLPNYKESVISVLPNLKILDGKVINAEDRQNHEISSRTQIELQELLLRNYCELIKLTSFMKKIELHKELIKKYPVFASNYNIPDLSQFRKIYHYYDYQEKAFVNIMRTQLLQDVAIIKTELGLKGKNSDSAFSELLVKQQQKISELTLKIEDQLKFLPKSLPKYSLNKQTSLEINLNKSSLTSCNSQRVLTSKTEPIKGEISILQYPITARESKAIFTSQLTTPQGQYLMTQGTQRNKPSIMEFSVGDKDLYQKLYAPKPELTFSGKPNAEKAEKIEKTYTKDFHGSSNWDDEIPRPAKLEATPLNADEFNKASNNKVTKVMTNDRKMINKSPIRGVTEKDINLMKKELIKKNEELNAINEFNKLLQKKNEEYQKLNPENSKIVQDEIKNPNIKIEKNVELQKDLENEIEFLNEKFNELLVKNYKLEHDNQVLQETEERALTYARELENYTKLEQKIQLAEKFREKKLLKYGLKSFVKGIAAHKKINEFILGLTTKKLTNQMKTFFGRLLKYKNTKKFLRLTTKKLIMKKISKCFADWKKIYLQRKIVKNSSESINERLLKVSIIHWKRFLTYKYQKRKNNEKGIISYKRKLLKKSFISLKAFHKRHHFKPNEEKGLMKKAQKYNHFECKKKHFKLWTKWLLNKHKPKMANNKKAYDFLRYRLLKFGLKILKSKFQIANKLHQIVNLKIKRNNTTLKRKFFNLWSIDYLTMCSKKNKLKKLQNCYIQKRLMGLWKKSLQMVVDERINIKNAALANKNRLKKKVLKSLNLARLKTKNTRLRAIALTTTTNSKSMSKYFLLWMRTFVSKVRNKEEQYGKKVQKQAKYFKAWMTFHKVQKRKKWIKASLQKHLINRIRDRLSNMLGKWYQITRSNIRNRGVLDLVKKKRELSMYQKVFYVMVNNVKKALKKNMVKAINKTLILEADMEDKYAFMNNMDAERMDMMEKINNLEIQLGARDDELKTKDQEIQSLKKALLQIHENEKELSSKLQDKDRALEDLQQQIEKNSNEHNKIFEKYQRDIEGVNNEKERLLNVIAELKNEIENKDGVIVDTEKALLEKSVKADHIIKDTEKKLTNAIKMGNEFKNAIEARESEIKILTQKLNDIRQENYEYERKLNESLVILMDSKLIYEKRIEELENMINVMNIEMIELKKRRDMNREGNIRKFGYDLDILMKNQDMKSDGILGGNTKDKKAVYEEKATREIEDKDDNNSDSDGGEVISNENMKAKRDFDNKQEQIKKKIAEFQAYLSSTKNNDLYTEDREKKDLKDHFSEKSTKLPLASSDYKNFARNMTPILHKSFVSDLEDSTILPQGEFRKKEAATTMTTFRNMDSQFAPEVDFKSSMPLKSYLYGDSTAKKQIYGTSTKGFDIESSHVQKQSNSLAFSKREIENIPSNDFEFDTIRKKRNQAREKIELRIKNLKENIILDINKAKVL